MASIGEGMGALALAGGIVGYLFVTHQTKQKRLEIIHQERLIAMEKGIPLPELPLEPATNAGGMDSQRVLPILGIVLLSLAAGAMVMMYLVLTGENHRLWVAPLPFLFLGVGLIAFDLMSRKSER